VVKKQNQNSNGMGIYQKNKAHVARQCIYDALSDGQWHRYMELKNATKLSPRTLSKHLENMNSLTVVERKEDTESGKYPVPVLYKANDQFLNDYIKPTRMRKHYSDNVNAMLEETKDPLILLDMILQFAQVDFIRILQEIQTNKKISGEEILFFEEAFLWRNFESFTMDLITSTYKMIDKININQLLLSQAKRQKEIWEMAIKRYEELGIKGE
jgi:DNA-binding HxlR family transcriptional regulator